MEPTSTGGVFMYHRACWRPKGDIGEDRTYFTGGGRR